MYRATAHGVTVYKVTMCRVPECTDWQCQDRLYTEENTARLMAGDKAFKQDHMCTMRSTQKVCKSVPSGRLQA